MKTWDISAVHPVKFGLKPHSKSVVIQVSRQRRSVISMEGSWKTSNDLSQSVSQSAAVASMALLFIPGTLFLGPTVFFSLLAPTNQQPFNSLPSTLCDTTAAAAAAAGSHSLGINLSRLEHSAKGHYPGLHVCWAAVFSNSTRCCCDQRVTCEGGVSICTLPLPNTPSLDPLWVSTPSIQTGFF